MVLACGTDWTMHRRPACRIRPWLSTTVLLIDLPHRVPHCSTPPSRERRGRGDYHTGVEHSVHIRDEFRRAGVMAEHLDGKTPLDERETILKGLADGRVELVANCAVLCEGWDQPHASCLILARPTKSLGLFRQMVG